MAITSFLDATRNENFGKDLVVGRRKCHSHCLCNVRKLCLDGLLQQVFEPLSSLRNRRCMAGSFFG
jgi:hypothetical protein